jgi:hypothetical protein
MKAFKRSLLLFPGILGLLFSLSCATGKPPTPVLPLVIDPAALPAAVVNVPYSATLKAVGGVAPYTWSLASGTLPAGLSISAGGVISGTPTALGTTNFKIQVTDVQTPTAAVDTATKSVTVNHPLAITTTSPLASGSVGVPYSAVLGASGGVPPYTWAITSGTLPAGLTLSTAGLISGTPTGQETQTFTVQASDSQSPSATATASLTLAISGPNGRLSGNYVFSFSGFINCTINLQCGTILQAGSFTADGQGNITSGLMDSNSNSFSGFAIKIPFTGTYSIGADNTGPMTLTVGGAIISYQIAVPASGTIRFMQNYNSGSVGTGVIRKVASPGPITIPQLAAFWSFGAIGADAAKGRYATVGTFQSDSSGNWTSVEQDANDNGSVSHTTTSTGKFVAIDPVTQRGTATLTANSVTTNYSLYPVSPTELLMLAIDPVSSTAPLALFTLDTRPINNFTNASLAFTTVAQLQGGGGVAGPYGLLAFAKFDGAGNVTVSTDENLSGTLSSNKYSATYSVAGNGRTTLTGFSSNPVVIYLAGSVGFILDGDPNVSSGTLLRQQVQQGTALSNSAISGSYQGGTLQTVAAFGTVETDSASADGAGNLALIYDISGAAGNQQGLMQAITYSVDSAGRTPFIVGGNTVGIAYVVVPAGSGIGGGKFLVLSTDGNANVNSLEQ